MGDSCRRCLRAGRERRRTSARRGSFDAERDRMVNEQLKGRDIRDPRVLAAIPSVPRHLFYLNRCGHEPTAIRPCRSDTTRPSLNPTSSLS